MHPKDHKSGAKETYRYPIYVILNIICHAQQPYVNEPEVSLVQKCHRIWMYVVCLNIANFEPLMRG